MSVFMPDCITPVDRQSPRIDFFCVCQLSMLAWHGRIKYVSDRQHEVEFN